MEELIEQLKKQIIEELDLTDSIPEEFNGDTLLFGEGDGLELDSIDALELIVMLEKRYQLKIEDPKKRRTTLKSVHSIATAILENENSK